MPPRGNGRGRPRGSPRELRGRGGMRSMNEDISACGSLPTIIDREVPLGDDLLPPRLQLTVIPPGEKATLATQWSTSGDPTSRNPRRGVRNGRGGVNSQHSMAVSSPPQYGQIVDSDMVHDEIREVANLVKEVVKQNFQRHGTEKNQVLAGIRQFGPSKQSKKILNRENEAARLAYEKGIYVVWRLMEEPRIRGATNDFCCRIGPRHRCFCGHLWSKHAAPRISDKKTARSGQVTQKHPCEECGCKAFHYVPNEPEEIGEGWLTRRTNWDPSKWSAKCRCGHGHKDHDPVSRFCRTCGGCSGFQSHFLCVVCDMPGEAHETVYETESDRHKAGLPVRQDYFPLADIDWDIREMVLKDATGGGALQAPNTHDIHEVTEEECALEEAKAGRSLLRIEDGKGKGHDLPRITGAGGLRSKTTNFSSDLPIQGTTSYSIADYCPSCATIYKANDIKTCGKCGRARPGRG